MEKEIFLKDIRIEGKIFLADICSSINFSPGFWGKDLFLMVKKIPKSFVNWRGGCILNGMALSWWVEELADGS